MYFISKGDCTVNLRDETGKEQLAVSLLVAGDHFGEIALIYRCKRTATIISRNYNNMARLEYDAWREIVCEFPKYNEHLKNYVYSYEDSRKLFLIKMISKIDFFKNLPTRILTELIYSLDSREFPEGSMVLKTYDRC